MLISHEVPIILLNESYQFNDYDYCLIHLYEKHLEYKKYFNAEERPIGRIVYLDNSAHELRDGEYFDFDKYAKYVREIQPDVYIIPDEFNDMEASCDLVHKWLNSVKHIPAKSKSMGVIHGKSYEEFVECYKFMVDRVDIIGFNYDETLYQDFSVYNNVALDKAMNRYIIIMRMVQDGVIDTDKQHHLLGIQVPQEVKWYARIPWIHSIDTSNPIMAGLEGLQYNIRGELSMKPKINIDMAIKISDINEKTMRIIRHNINSFNINTQV